MVVLVLGALAAVVGLAGEGRERHVLEVMELQIRETAARARALAREAHMPCGVVFDPATERLGLVDEHGELVRDPVGGSPWVIDGRALAGGGVDIVSADFGDAGRAAVFDAQGVPLSPGRVVLRAGSTTRELLLDEVSGRFTTP